MLFACAIRLIWHFPTFQCGCETFEKHLKMWMNVDVADASFNANENEHAQ